MIVTASLTTGVARATHGMTDSIRLIDGILRTNHLHWESTLFVGETEFHRTKDGPFSNHQFRVSVSPSSGFAALNYMDHDDSEMPMANTYNPKRPLPEVDLIFNGTTGAVFPAQRRFPSEMRARHSLSVCEHEHDRHALNGGPMTRTENPPSYEVSNDHDPY